MRIAYLSGPTDAEAIFADLRSGAAPNYFGTNYMRQFLIFADEIGAEALIATWNEGGEHERKRERFTFLNVPPAQGATGLRYYWQMLRLQLAFLWKFLRFRPDVLLLTGNQDFWWVMAPLKLGGTRFVASFHGVIWPKYRPPTLQQRILRPLNEWLALRRLDAAVHTSEDIRAQLETATGWTVCTNSGFRSSAVVRRDGNSRILHRLSNSIEDHSVSCSWVASNGTRGCSISSRWLRSWKTKIPAATPSRFAEMGPPWRIWSGLFAIVG